MFFPAPFLESLKDAITLSTVIGRFLPLRKKGPEFQACCPFHTEKTPSFTVNDQKGFYHCFGCGAHGNCFDFLMKMENIAFPEAVEKLAVTAGIPLPKPTDSDQMRADAEVKNDIHKVLEAAAVFYEKQLHTSLGEHARDYLKSRHVSEDTLKNFRLGYAPKASQSLWTHLIQQKFTPSVIHKAGLAIEGDKPFDRFRDRLMFPITDKNGRVIAFGGRILGDGEPKYLNSPETEVFHKGKTLYNFAAARRVRQGPTLLVEGYMDVIALVQGGIDQTVAPLGTALTASQLELAWTLTPEPIICFDGDKAGQRAASRAVDQALPLLKPGYSLKYLTLPPQEDPDTFIRHKGPEAFRNLCQKAIPLIDHIWETYLTHMLRQTPEQQALFEKTLLDLTKKIQDQTIRQNYVHEFRSRINSLRYGKKTDGSKKISRVTPRAALKPKEIHQQILLLTLIKRPDALPHLHELCMSLEFTDPRFSEIRDIILIQFYDGTPLENQTLEPYLIKEGHEIILSGFDQIRLHAPFLWDKNYPLEEIVDQWKEILESFLGHAKMQEHIAFAKDILQKEMSQDAWERYQELKKLVIKKSIS